MGSAAQIPFSNPAGNNQTKPGAGFNMGTAQPGVTPIPGSPQAGPGANPYIPGGITPPNTTAPGTTGPQHGTLGNAPITPGQVLPGAAGTVGGSPTTVASPGSTSENATNTLNQMTDILGQGVGTDVTNLLNSIGGTDSATLQEFIQSLAPQEATAQAGVNASLGAGGVSANSSVAAIADSNLQSQEFATISGESANLTQEGQQLESSILTGLEPAAQQEVASSGWNIFGDVMSAVGSDAPGIAKMFSGI